MKKIFLLPIFILTFVSFSSCEKDESLDPRPLFVSGQFMRLDIKRDRLNVNDPNTSFGGPLTNPSNTVVRYELFVRLTRGGVVQSDYIPYDVLTTFPQELAITPAKIEQAYEAAGQSVAPLANGDAFRFIAYSYDSAGVKRGYYNLSRTVQTNKGYKQAYRFNLILTDNLTAPLNNYEP